MKHFIRLMAQDILSEHFSSAEHIAYGIVAPLALVAALMLASLIS